MWPVMRDFVWFQGMEKELNVIYWCCANETKSYTYIYLGVLQVLTCMEGPPKELLVEFRKAENIWGTSSQLYHYYTKISCSRRLINFSYRKVFFPSFAIYYKNLNNLSPKSLAILTTHKRPSSLSLFKTHRNILMHKSWILPSRRYPSNSPAPAKSFEKGNTKQTLQLSTSGESRSSKKRAMAALPSCTSCRHLSPSHRTHQLSRALPYRQLARATSVKSETSRRFSFPTSRLLRYMAITYLPSFSTHTHTAVSSLYIPNQVQSAARERSAAAALEIKVTTVRASKKNDVRERASIVGEFECVCSRASGAPRANVSQPQQRCPFG